MKKYVLTIITLASFAIKGADIQRNSIREVIMFNNFLKELENEYVLEHLKYYIERENKLTPYLEKCKKELETNKKAQSEILKLNEVLKVDKILKWNKILEEKTDSYYRRLGKVISLPYDKNLIQETVLNNRKKSNFLCGLAEKIDLIESDYINKNYIDLESLQQKEEGNLYLYEMKRVEQKEKMSLTQEQKFFIQKEAARKHAL